jgi:F0F1-type ATP synthase gamma subunit
MSKATRAQEDLEDLTNLRGLIDILKNIASNRFHKRLKQKRDRDYFTEALMDFFKLALSSSSKGNEKQTTNDSVAVLALTAEGGFMANLTARVIREALDLTEEYDVVEFHVIGQAGVNKIKTLSDMKVVPYIDIKEDRFYEIALAVKDSIIELIHQNKVGKLLAVSPVAKSISVVKQEIVQLYPPDVSTGEDEASEEKEETNLIYESDPEGVLDRLAGLWMTSKIMKLLEECSIAGFAMQSQQLESSLDALETQEKKALLTFRKAKRAEIDKSLREAFANTLIVDEG